MKYQISFVNSDRKTSYNFDLNIEVVLAYTFLVGKVLHDIVHHLQNIDPVKIYIKSNPQISYNTDQACTRLMASKK